MPPDSNAIRDWFNLHADDGEFALATDSSERLRVDRPRADARLVYSTKRLVLAEALAANPDARSLGAIGQYGLPSDAEIESVDQLVGDSLLLFLGDLDPVDLLIFAVLRARLGTNRVRHLGVNDACLAVLKLAIPSNFVQECSPSELAARALLRESLPDLEALVGPNCAQMLNSGHKLEMEAIVAAAGSAREIVRLIVC